MTPCPGRLRTFQHRPIARTLRPQPGSCHCHVIAVGRLTSVHACSWANVASKRSLQRPQWVHRMHRASAQMPQPHFSAASVLPMGRLQSTHAGGLGADRSLGPEPGAGAAALAEPGAEAAAPLLCRPFSGNRPHDAIHHAPLRSAAPAAANQPGFRIRVRKPNFVASGSVSQGRSK